MCCLIDCCVLVYVVELVVEVLKSVVGVWSWSNCMWRVEGGVGILGFCDFLAISRVSLKQKREHGDGVLICALCTMHT